MSKRGALDAFFQASASSNKRLKTGASVNTDNAVNTSSLSLGSPPQKQTESSNDAQSLSQRPSHHSSYPFPIAALPQGVLNAIRAPNSPSTTPKTLDHLPDLDCLYYEPFLARQDANALFCFLREKLFFYRVSYQIKRGGMGDMTINTPRFTTVFGVDTSSYFAPTSDDAQATSTDDGTSYLRLYSTATKALLPHDKTSKAAYQHTPRPLPTCLDQLRMATEAATGCRFNICLVNYYASGKDSISFHSDDERFLGPNPAIASFSLGGRRDFLLKHKPLAKQPLISKEAGKDAQPQMKLPLGSGDMILMRGPTQSNWLHSIPKRGGKKPDEIEGRINITFRRALVKGGTENYYTYNVGNGGVLRWDDGKGEMVPWLGK